MKIDEITKSVEEFKVKLEEIKSLIGPELKKLEELYDEIEEYIEYLESIEAGIEDAEFSFDDITDRFSTLKEELNVSRTV